MEMKEVHINTGTRALRSEWTREMATDLNSISGYDFDERFSEIFVMSRRRVGISDIFPEDNLQVFGTVPIF
jgi:hypothetical protein